MGLCLIGSTASGQLQFFWESAVQSAHPGDVLTYSGSLTNAGSETIFLNGSAYDFSADNMVLDDSAFLANAPVSLAAGESSSLFPMFTLTVAPTVLENTYSGAFTILGGNTDVAQIELATQNFAVRVVPAPSGLFVGALGSLPALLWLRRKYVMR